MEEKLYSETDTTIYTKEALRQKIKDEPSFSDFCVDYLMSRYSRTEIFINLTPEFMNKVVEETIEDIIWHDYYEIEVEE